MARQVCKCGRTLVRSANATCWRCWKDEAKNALIRVDAIQTNLFEDL